MSSSIISIAQKINNFINDLKTSHKGIDSDFEVFIRHSLIQAKLDQPKSSNQKINKFIQYLKDSPYKIDAKFETLIRQSLIRAKLNPTPTQLKSVARKLLPKKVSVSAQPQSEWQKICQVLSKDYKLDQLKTIATDFEIPIEGQSKRQLCSQLAKKICTNPQDLAFEEVDFYDPMVYKYKDPQTQNQFCFTSGDFTGYIKNKKQNPYNRQVISPSDYQKMLYFFDPQVPPAPQLRPIQGRVVPEIGNRPLTGYQYFVRQMMPIMRAQGIPPNEGFGPVSNMWRNLSQDEKENYKRLARSVVHQVPQPQPQPIPRAPRRITGWQYFVREMMPIIRGQANIPVNERLSTLASMWRILSQDEKDNYVRLAREQV